MRLFLRESIVWVSRFDFGDGGSTLVRADGSPKYSMICMLTGAFINLILNPLFVFVMDWGIAGSASATVIGRCVGAYGRWIFKKVQDFAVV